MTKQRELRPPTCGHCRWRVGFDDDDEVGRCTANPPGMMFDPDGDLVTIWPLVSADDPGCRLFSGNQ